MRRNLILEQSNSPEEWNALFNSIENSNAAWAFPASDRLKWTETNSEKTNKPMELQVKTMAQLTAEGQSVDVLFWVGCGEF